MYPSIAKVNKSVDSDKHEEGKIEIRKQIDEKPEMEPKATNGQLIPTGKSKEEKHEILIATTLGIIACMSSEREARFHLLENAILEDLLQTINLLKENDDVQAACGCLLGNMSLETGVSVCLF
jgi:hypothetical protein